MQEELHEQTLLANRDYIIVRTFSEPITYKGVSRTYGAFTRYKCYFFTAKVMSKGFKLASGDQWLTQDEMAKGRTSKGSAIRNSEA